MRSKRRLLLGLAKKESFSFVVLVLVVSSGFVGSNIIGTGYIAFFSETLLARRSREPGRLTHELILTWWRVAIRIFPHLVVLTAAYDEVYVYITILLKLVRLSQ